VCDSILENRGVMSGNKTIKYNPAKSLLKLQIGDEIKLTESNFVSSLELSLLKSKPNSCSHRDDCSGAGDAP
jgi:hypothetical protein